MGTRITRLAALFAMVFLMLGSVSALDVDIDVPEITLSPKGLFAPLTRFGVDELLNTELADLAAEFETEIETDPEIEKYSDQPLLAEGFANAGAASAMSGLYRTQHGYKLFSAAYGLGMAFSMPGVDFLEELNSASFIEDEGDIYAGLAMHPLNLSASVNLGFLVPGLRVNGKFGYYDMKKGTITEDISFNSLSVGAGASYQLIKPKSVPVGIVKWHGIVVASGFYYQRNRAEMSYTPDEEGFESSTSITLGDFLTADQIVAVNAADIFSGGTGGYTSSSVLGLLTTTPEINAKIESSTFTIPLEVSTAVRVLYLLEVMVGAGVDLSFGSGEVSLSAESDVDFEVHPEFTDDITVTQGSAEVTNKTTADPQLIRPRLMTALGLGLGPVRIEFPFIYYFDSEGNTFVTGITAGFML